MNRNAIIAEDLASTTVTVDANPLPLRLPVGSALFAVRGEVWLTQEGMSDDVILAPGARFDVRGRGSVVVSALRDDAVLYVAQPADARADATADLHTLLSARAARLRREAIATARIDLGRPLARLAARLRALTRTRRPAW